VASDDSQRIKDLERQLAQLQKVVKTQQQKPVKKTPKVHPLQQDCVDALMAIGYNKTEAKKIVKSHLTDSITSTRDFLMIAMAK
jgi:Holliday junction resolvasome RuvABC DNA-binding subunit